MKRDEGEKGGGREGKGGGGVKEMVEEKDVLVGWWRTARKKSRC